MGGDIHCDSGVFVVLQNWNGRHQANGTYSNIAQFQRLRLSWTCVSAGDGSHSGMCRNQSQDSFENPLGSKHIDRAFNIFGNEIVA